MTSIPRAQMKGFGLIRDKNGNPKLPPHPEKEHPAILSMLTIAERKKLGIWTGAFGIGSQGTGRMSAVTGGYRAEDRIVALREIYDGKKYLVLDDRVDLSVGDIVKIK